MSTGFALQSGLPCLPLQHHFAHIHAVLAENQHAGPAIGLALDGTGLGDDGTIWGGEALMVDTGSLGHQRVARFSHVMLPGGDLAAREPWRVARSYLHALGILEPAHKPWPWLESNSRADRIVSQMLDRRLNAPCPRAAAAFLTPYRPCSACVSWFPTKGRPPSGWRQRKTTRKKMDMCAP